MVAETLDPKPCTLKVLTCVGSMDGVDVCDMCWLNAPETLTRAVSAASDGDGSMEMVPAGGKGRPSFPWPPHDGEERKLRRFRCLRRITSRLNVPEGRSVPSSFCGSQERQHSAGS